MTQSSPFSSDAINDSLGFVKKLWGGRSEERRVGKEC